ncbi:MAG: hypothetical protein HYY68_06785 [Thaumarchaeota archaeon]|nr:hypothetical protein [Nitrososphaerota archaeon]MBI3023416.1 hypothetical protein [Nitrososphaerota archaeon]
MINTIAESVYPNYSVRLNFLSDLGVGQGVITLVAIVLFTAGQYLGMGVGGMERMIVYPELIWLVSFGAYLMSSE